MMNDKFNSDSKVSEANARQLRGVALSDWDHRAMIKAVWSLADNPVLKLFADPSPIQRNQYH
jgi:hypothetical protein